MLDLVSRRRIAQRIEIKSTVGIQTRKAHKGGRDSKLTKTLPLRSHKVATVLHTGTSGEIPVELPHIQSRTVVLLQDPARQRLELAQKERLPLTVGCLLSHAYRNRSMYT